MAIKRVYQNKSYKTRELDLLLEARGHPFIIDIVDHFYANGERPNDTYLNIVSPLYSQNLSQVIHRARRLYTSSNDSIPLIYIPMIGVKMFAWQLLRALGFLHGKGIVHRDVKP